MVGFRFLRGMITVLLALPCATPMADAQAARQPATPAATRTPGAPKLDLPGALWIDRDSDGRVDGYVYKGEVYAEGGGKVPVSPTAASNDTTPKTAHWGGLDRLEGKTFQYHTAGLTRTTTWRWVKRGEVLAADMQINGSSVTIEHMIDPRTGVVAGYSLDPDGTLGTAAVDVEGKPTRTTMKVLGPYAYETRVEQFRRGRWSTMMMGKETYSAVGGQGESGGGDGTVRRILGGALMGAMLGGGGQDSVDLAVAGAQAAAQGGNTLEVLNSMGDVAAVKQAESARQLEDTIAQAQAPSPVSAPQASTSEESPRASVQPESSAAADKEDRARADREAADAERQRVAEAARKKAEADKAQRRAEDLAAREKAAAEAKQRREQQTRQDESNLRSSFSGRASTCAGGGSGILYLQTSRPPKLGCNVQFEARCPGTQPGNGTTFGQNNYVGGSCMGIGDAIQIGTMSCPADQVQVQMTGASCS